MEVKAHTRYLRMSPRKVRLVVDAVRGMAVDPAIAQLTFMSRAAARPVKKLLESAVANATHNFKLDREGLFIKSALVNQGPTLKRWRPRAMGSAAPILKRTCHITLVLDSKTGMKKEEAKEEVKAEKKEKKAAKKPAAKKVAAKKK
jgi:large subunit ribosomal protein L22